MKKRWISLIMGFILTSCASQEPTTGLLEDAVSAMKDSAHAQECAVETFALAQAALKEAQAAQAAGDEETARSKARLAQSLAKQAKEEAEKNAEDCDRRKNATAAVEQMLEDELTDAPTVESDVAFKVIYFDFDESSLSTAAVADLQSNVAILRANPNIDLFLTAHTDDRGTTEYNLALSQRRGDTVRAHVMNMGIDGARMQVVPYGKEKPASTGTREQDYALNRRVEFMAR